MSALLVSAAAALLIRPSIDPPTVSPAWAPYQLQWLKSVEWSCRMRSAQDRDFIVEGQFEKPITVDRDKSGLTRPVMMRSSKPLELAGSGTASMGWASTKAGWHQFETTVSSVTYRMEMDYIEPGVPGFMKILSSDRLSGGGAPIWKFEGVGVCTTKELKAQRPRK